MWEGKQSKLERVPAKNSVFEEPCFISIRKAKDKKFREVEDMVDFCWYSRDRCGRVSGII